MKHKIHGLLIGVTLILVLSFCFSLSAFAEGGADGAVPKEPDVEVVEGSDRYGAELTVYSESVSLEYSAGRMYYLSVYASGSVNFASYEMYLMLPEFMEIKNVFYKGNSEEVFVYNIEGDNILKVTYSSTYDRCYAQLFEIEFELSKESIGAIGYPMFTSGAIFTNTNFETFYASSSFGEVKVTSGGPLKGDFNLDGVVTLEDVILIQRAIVGLEDYSEASFYAADIDRNGSVNIVDVQYIRMYLIKAIDSLEELQPTDRFTFRVMVMSKGGSYRGERIFYGNPQMTYRQLFDSVFNSLSGEYSMLDYESAYTESGVNPYSDEYLSNNDAIYIRENIYITNIVIRLPDGYETEIRMGGDEEETYASMFGYMREYLEELVKMGKFGELDYDNAYTESGESVFDETKHLYRDDVIYISEKAITFTDDEIRTQIYVIGNTPTIYQNSDREAVLDALVGREIMMEQYAEKNGRRYYISNEEIEITADMIGDLSKVDLSKIDNYVSFPIVIDGETFTINVNIIPDLSNAKVRYQVVRVTESRYYDGDGSYYTKPYYYYAELFDNGVMRTCPFDERQNENPWYNYAEYTTETYGNDQIVVITGDGMEGCYVITRETTYQGYPIIEDYQPSEEADVVSYSLMLGKQMIRLDVFNENYAMLYENMNNNGEMRFESTIKVSIDAENHTLTFMGSTYQIGEGNLLSIPLPEGDPTEIVYYLGNEVVFLLYENNVGVYTMNGAVATTVEWKYDTDSDGIEILIVNIYGTELTFYKWNIDGQWHQNTEPNFEKATVQSLIYGEETWLLYTFSEYSSCYLKTADSPALIQGYYYGNAVTVYGPMGDLKLRIVDGELVPMEDDDEPNIIEAEEEGTVSVIIKELMGEESTDDWTISAPVGMTVYEALEFDSSIIGTTETEEQEDGTVVIYTLAGLFRDPTGREEYTEKDVVEDGMVIYILYTIASYTGTF